MTQIRSFRNADLPILLELWIQHWSALGPPPQVNTARLEQAVLARTFFEPSNLLLAETEGVAQGWIHFSASPTADETALIEAVCLSATCSPSVSAQLLEAAEKQILEGGFRRVCAGLLRDDQFGYAGLDPIGHGIGIPTCDSRITALLQEHGYAPQRDVARMTASIVGYRPPVNREALQFRRTTRVKTVSFRPRDARQASAMSHLDVEQVRLLSQDRRGRQGDTELARVGLWLSDAEAEVMRPSLAILDIAEPHERGRLESAEIYLIGALVQSLAQRRIETIETAVDEEKSELVSQLEALHFQSVENGAAWAKTLSA